MKITKAKIAEAVSAGSKLIGYIIEAAPTGPVGKVIGSVLQDVVPRAIEWFSKSPTEIKNDALFKAMRKPLRSRILLEIEREKRQSING